MNITCPNCNFSKPVDPAKVPDRPVKVNCPKCQTAFTFDKTTQGRPAGSTPEQISCPACGLVQVKTDSCSGCGVNYAKFQSRKAQNQADGDRRGEEGLDLDALRRNAYSPQPGDRAKAGFWIRVVASVIDSFLLSLVQFALTFAITLSVGVVGVTATDDPATSLVVWLFGATISLGYAVFFTGYCGQTPGKMAVRIKVIRTDGGQMTYGRAAKREILGKFVSSILLGIGYLMVAFDNQKQGLHDKIADTYVIKL